MEANGPQSQQGFGGCWEVHTLGCPFFGCKVEKVERIPGFRGYLGLKKRRTTWASTPSTAWALANVLAKAWS